MNANSGHSQSNEEVHERLLVAAINNDTAALGELLQLYRKQLLRTVQFRMDPQLRSRIDAEDVIQETYIEATKRFDRWQDQSLPFFLWLRFLAIQKLFQLHRRHLGAQARDAKREVSIFSQPSPQATSAVLAAHLLGKHTSPSLAAIRAETTSQVEDALNSLNEVDREILAMRRFERLKNNEVATLLNITTTAASNRYIRALERLQQAMASNSDSSK